MARARNIKPGFFGNEDLVALPFEYRLLFAGLWTVADKAGRLEDRPLKIKMAIFPADAVDVDAGLSALDGKFIRRYEVDGQRYIEVINWDKHQSPHHTERASTIPPYVNGELTVKSRKQDGGNPPDSLIPDSLIPDSLEKHTPAEPAMVEQEPDGLDLESWTRWEKYRRDIKKPIKPASIASAKRKLAGFGGKQSAVVEESIANGWQGLFSTGERNGQAGSSRGSRVADTIAELTGANRSAARTIEGSADRVD